MVLEYAPNGNLFQFMKKNEMDSSLKKKIFLSVCAALQFLHKKKVLHRDIKPENILLGSKFQVKLCDFGWSIGDVIKRKTFCGTYEYMAPEILEKKQYDEKVDIWSLGILLYELFHNKSPFWASTHEGIYKKIK